MVRPGEMRFVRFHTFHRVLAVSQGHVVKLRLKSTGVYVVSLNNDYRVMQPNMKSLCCSVNRLFTLRRANVQSSWARSEGAKCSPLELGDFFWSRITTTVISRGTRCDLEEIAKELRENVPHKFNSLSTLVHFLLQLLIVPVEIKENAHNSGKFIKVFFHPMTFQYTPGQIPLVVWLMLKIRSELKRFRAHFRFGRWIDVIQRDSAEFQRRSVTAPICGKVLPHVGVGKICFNV